jgi:hypothetical protein
MSVLTEGSQTDPITGSERTYCDAKIKRLERGSFQLPPGGDAASLAIEVDSVTLAMMIGGVDLGTAKRRKRYQVAGE